MVTDSLQNLEQYRGLHKNMDTVIDFLKKCDLTALPDGKTVIDGERVFVNVMEADLREAEGDCGLAAGRSRCGGTLGDGSFALFLPEEFHKPSCKNGSHTHVRKAVVKIEM